MLSSYSYDSHILTYTTQANVGGPETFSALCVFNDGYEIHKANDTNDDGLETIIQTAAFKMDFVFVSEAGWFNETDYNETDDDVIDEIVDSIFERGLGGYDEEEFEGEDDTGQERRLGTKSPKQPKQPKVCTQDYQESCCVADAILWKAAEYKGKKRWCKKNNCKLRVCSKNRRLRSLMSSQNSRGLRSKTVKPEPLVTDDFYDKSFNEVLGKYAVLDPIDTGAVLDATSLEDLVECRASSYNATEYDTPTLKCEAFANSSCDDNDYIDVESNETDNNVTQEFCLPDDYYCEDADLCTEDTWDPDYETCHNVPVSCPQYQSCDPVDG